MDDDDKKPSKRHSGTGGRKPGPQGAEGKPFRKPAGDRKPYAKAEDAKKPFRKFDGERKPYAKADGGEKRPFRKREDAAAGAGGEKRPFRKFDGERKPYAKAEGGEKRPFRKREDAALGAGGEKRPFRKFDGERKPYVKAEGDEKRPFRKREDEGAFRPGRRERETGAEVAAGGEERIARRLARAGVASRRDAEEMIAAGRVTLNGKVLASPAINVTASDRIELDGKEIPAVERTRLFLFHKPAGVVTTNRDPQGRKTVFDILPAGLPRLMTVGRLDINTEGLLLLTNDGGLSRVLELPATGWLRRYRVRVHGKVEPEKLAALKDGIAVDGVFYGAIDATLDREQGSNAWLTMAFREGKNREVRNVLGALGLDVTRLIRVSYGPFQLGELAEGEVRELKGRLLRDQLGERLIAESGANFDAPVLKEFSSKPVAAARKPEAEAGAPQNRKRERERKREDALDRLQTSRPPARGGGKKFAAREEKPVEPARQRKANVWMAPGARPVGEKKAAALAARNEGRRYAGKPRPAAGKAGGKGGYKPGGPAKGPRKPRGDR